MPVFIICHGFRVSVILSCYVPSLFSCEVCVCVCVFICSAALIVILLEFICSSVVVVA